VEGEKKKNNSQGKEKRKEKTQIIGRPS